MSNFDPFSVYRQRLEMDECYSEPSEAVGASLKYDLISFGLVRLGKISHGVLVFCMDQDDRALCLPWLIAPDAPDRDLIGGRHGLVRDEVYELSEQGEKLRSYKWGKVSYSEPISYDDCWSFYVLPKASKAVPYTLLVDRLNADKVSDDQIELVRVLTNKGLTDHEVYLTQGDDGEMLRIHQGVTEPKAYGLTRAMVDTIAPLNDVVGRAREVDNYAGYATKYGLSRSDFHLLARFAVEAFHKGMQVSLDDLCQEIQRQNN